MTGPAFASFQRNANECILKRQNLGVRGSGGPGIRGSGDPGVLRSGGPGVLRSERGPGLGVLESVGPGSGPQFSKNRIL